MKTHLKYAYYWCVNRVRIKLFLWSFNNWSIRLLKKPPHIARQEIQRMKWRAAKSMPTAPEYVMKALDDAFESLRELVETRERHKFSAVKPAEGDHVVLYGRDHNAGEDIALRTTGKGWEDGMEESLRENGIILESWSKVSHKAT
jgi:hypothetical protein